MPIWWRHIHLSFCRATSIDFSLFCSRELTILILKMYEETDFELVMEFFERLCVDLIVLDVDDGRM